MAVRIAGINIPIKKHTRIGLRAIFGIGDTSARKICAKVGINPSTRVKDLTDVELESLRVVVSEYPVEGDLRRERSMNIKRKMDLGCYEGIRHRKGLPLHGQRTKTNARTRKGKRKSVHR